jgi:hypothetical protein
MPLKTPEHIAPVWYFTPFYSVLRAVPDKFWGFVAFAASVAIPFAAAVARPLAGEVLALSRQHQQGDAGRVRRRRS